LAGRAGQSAPKGWGKVGLCGWLGNSPDNWPRHHQNRRVKNLIAGGYAASDLLDNLAREN
jgi:hypothetical protein